MEEESQTFCGEFGKITLSCKQICHLNLGERTEAGRLQTGNRKKSCDKFKTELTSFTGADFGFSTYNHKKVILPCYSLRYAFNL